MKQLTKISSFLTLIVLFTLSSCVKNEVTNVKLSKSTISINVGQSDSLVTTVTLTGDMTKQPVTWTAGDSKIVTVKEGTEVSNSETNTSGSFTKTIVITGVSAGTTNLTIRAGDKTAICQITIGQTNYSFNKVLASNWGDYYETGNNSFDMYLLENSLSIDTSGNISGTGTFIYFDFSVPITQNTMAAGDFTLTNTGDVNTFFPGAFVKNQSGDTIAIGTHIVTVSTTEIRTTLVKDGHYTVTANGDNFLIEGDVTTETNEIIHFSFSGAIPVADKREVPVELFPAFTQGRLYYYGDAYNSGTSNNFVAYLATKDVNFADSTIKGEVLMLELNTARTVTDSIPNGTYNMMPDLTMANLIPGSLVPGYLTTSGAQWGTWYFGDTTKKLKTGNIVVNKTGSQYTINYQLYDRVGSKISGTFTGALDYYNGTATSSGVAAQAGVDTRIKKSTNETRSFTSNLQKKANKIKTFRYKR
jgi:uncharacterized Zn-binding protein involved in type VI secretion